jgi:hypothetical protein
MRSCLAAAVLLVAALAACNNKSGGAAPAGSTSTVAPASSSSASSPAPGASSAGAPKGPTTKLTGQQLKDAYAAVLAGDDPFDKELAAVKAKLGDPQKVQGDTSLWWGWAPKEGAVDPPCYELSMSPTEGSSVGGTDWSKCGMSE